MRQGLPEKRFHVVVEMIRRTRPTARYGELKQKFNFAIKPNYHYHELRFVANRNYHVNGNDDPRLLVTWLLESDQRLLSGQLDFLYGKSSLDDFLLKNPFGNMYRLERLLGESSHFESLGSGTLYANHNVTNPIGRLLISK